MNSEDFIFLLKHPKKIDALKTQQLEEIIEEFPYFQSAHAIQLKGLNKINSFKYNQALKKTAAYTIDRKVLFEFITSQNFSINLNSRIEILEEIEVIEPETIHVLHKKIIDSFKKTPSEKIAVSAQIPVAENTEEEKATEILEIGKPIKFNSSEPHSFNEWMQLISQKPVNRDEKAEKIVKKQSKTEEKYQLIDKFIELNPKINPVDKNTNNQYVTLDRTDENDSLMTETLAKVYLEQQKYESAIKAYHILSLKYPEKSGFFADRIKAIKILQKNKS